MAPDAKALLFAGETCLIEGEKFMSTVFSMNKHGKLQLPLKEGTASVTRLTAMLNFEKADRRTLRASSVANMPLLQYVIFLHILADQPEKL